MNSLCCTYKPPVVFGGAKIGFSFVFHLWVSNQSCESNHDESKGRASHVDILQEIPCGVKLWAVSADGAVTSLVS